MVRCQTPKTIPTYDYVEAVKAAEAQSEIFWLPTEPKVEKDMHCIKTELSEAELHGVMTTLKLFTLYELVAGDNYWGGRFKKMFPRPDFKRMAATFANTELNVHMPFYQRIDELLGLSSKASNLCTEITLHADEDHSYTCVLSGMVGSSYDEWKDTDAVYCMTIFLDCMVGEFLEMARGIQGLEKIVRGTEKSRAIGLGFSGLHTLFQKKGLPFESYEAHALNHEVFSHIHEESLRASQWMAVEYGEPEWCRGYGVRNTHRTALAPNVSSSLIFGSESQGITPWYGNVYTEGSAAGDMYRVNPMFIELLKKHGMYNEEVLKDVLDNNGSCQHLTFLNEEEKLLYRTAFEIDQEAILRLASYRQQYICQSQSLNLFFDADEDEEYISEVHKKAFLDPNIKSLYYLRSKAGVSASKGECIACQS